MIACRIVDARKLENEKRIQSFSKLTRLVVTESLLDLLARVHAERAVAHDGLVDRLAGEHEGLGGALGIEDERLSVAGENREALRSDGMVLHLYLCSV